MGKTKNRAGFFFFPLESRGNIEHQKLGKSKDI